MMRKNLFILRGLPGSGKTTVGSLIVEDKNHLLSADNYFEDENGNYNFDMTKIGAAHEYCRKKCEFLMVNNVVKIVVANTFTQEWEMLEYENLSKKYSYSIHYMILENRHGNNNIHNVPLTTINKMKDRFEIKLI